MAVVNHIKREINAKIVYYGPERSGKATSLRYVYDRIKPELRGDLKSVPASGSSLLFFDFNPFEQPVFRGYSIRLHIYTLQGPVANPAAWKMTLKGADGLVIVTDATAEGMSVARQSVAQLREFLLCYGMWLDDLPVVLQLNKSDFAGSMTAETAELALGLPPGCTVCSTCAVSGEGVLKTLASLSRIVMGRIGERDDLSSETDTGSAAAHVETAAEGVQPADATAEPAEPVMSSVPRVCAPPDTIFATGTSDDALPRVVIAEGGVRIEGGSIRIPLEVSCSTGLQRLMVSVIVVAE
jgi:uncharacterized protein